MDVQAWASQSMNQLASFLPFGYAFGAGMVSAVNPCGFAMLPVYLSLYLGAEEIAFKQRSWFYRLGKALAVTVMVTSGFGLLFGLLGIVVSAGGTFLLGLMPWVSVVIGALLILLGIWLLLGHHLSLDGLMQLGSRIGDPRTISVRGFFLFGVAFGATSLSCTLPIFLVVVGGSLVSGNFVTGLLQFLWYVLGTGSVLLVMTIGMAFVKTGAVVGAFRRFLPYVTKISAILLIAAGVYICYYWLSSGLLLH